MEKELIERAGGECELCKSKENLSAMEVYPVEDGSIDRHVLACEVCQGQIEDPSSVDPNHWRCLNDAMWSPVPAVQVVSWRMLDRISAEGWPAELQETMYMDEATTAWAKLGQSSDSNAPMAPHKDANGNVLNDGDSVTLAKSLNVKGGGFTAKQGTAVKNISLDQGNSDYIEGKINGQKIMILTKYVKKA